MIAAAEGATGPEKLQHSARDPFGRATAHAKLQRRYLGRSDWVADQLPERHPQRVVIAAAFSATWRVAGTELALLWQIFRAHGIPKSLFL